MALQFSEEILAGGPQDVATVRHLVLKGSNVEIGRKIGEVARHNHRAVLSMNALNVAPEAQQPVPMRP